MKGITMAKTTFKKGDKVRISNRYEGHHTKDTQGWDSDMKYYIGTQQTVDFYDDYHESVILDGLEYNWDPRDLVLLSDLDSHNLSGDTVSFDVKELV